MSKTYDVYMCRNATEPDSVLLQIYEAITRREVALLSGRANNGLSVSGNSITMARPKSYIKNKCGDSK